MPGKCVSLILLLCFGFVCSSAQKNLKAALVVFNNNDTAKGFIDYKEWLTSPVAVLFTKDKNIPVTRYTTTELNYFEVVDQVRYQRYTVRVSLSTDAMSNTSGKDTTAETRTVFLKIVEDGNPLALFSYKDDLKQRLYVLDKNNTTPVELLNSVYMLNDQVYEEKQYRTDLAGRVVQYKAGDSRLLSQINGMGYYTSDVADICRQIDGTTKQVSKHVVKSRSGPALRIFAGGGVNHGSLKMEGANLFTGKTSHPFYYPLADIGADLFLNPDVGKFVFRMQLHITGYKTAAYSFLDYGVYQEVYTFAFKQLDIAVAPQLLYNIYNQKKIKWFAAAGPQLNFSSYPENKYYFLRKSSTDSDTTDNSYLKNLKSGALNFCFSTGVSVGRLELSAVYNTTSSVTQTAGYGLDNSSLQMRLNFYFKK